MCSHWLSVYRISKIMHCGILINIPYWITASTSQPKLGQTVSSVLTLMTIVTICCPTGSIKYQKPPSTKTNNTPCLSRKLPYSPARSILPVLALLPLELQNGQGRATQMQAKWIKLDLLTHIIVLSSLNSWLSSLDIRASMILLASAFLILSSEIEVIGGGVILTTVCTVN